nr:cell division ATP-binding protein FtsE [Clostridium transplantifaecale]
MKMENNMIVFDKVSKVYQTGQKALKQVNMTIEKGEFVFLLGDSGAGKTTFLDLILKETEPTEGEITVNGIVLSQLKQRQVYRYRRFLGVVFQDFKLFSDFNVYENVAFAQMVNETPPAQIKEQVMTALTRVGLERKIKNYPDQLSGGEKQRVALARAIVNKPALILADEPTGNLDQKNAAEIMWLLEKINEAGTTVIVVTHNRDIVKRMQKREITLQHGKVIMDSRRGGYFYEP